MNTKRAIDTRPAVHVSAMRNGLRGSNSWRGTTIDQERRKEHQFQGQKDIARMRDAWRAWDEQAERQARDQQRIALQNGQRRMEAGGFYSEIDLDGWSPPDDLTTAFSGHDRRGFTRRNVSEKQWDDVRTKAMAAAKRVEQKQSWLSRRQNIYKGVEELDPSGRLGAKVQRLSELTRGMQQARTSKQPFFRTSLYEPESYASEVPGVKPTRPAAGRQRSGHSLESSTAENKSEAEPAPAPPYQDLYRHSQLQNAREHAYDWQSEAEEWLQNGRAFQPPVQDYSDWNSDDKGQHHGGSLQSSLLGPGAVRQANMEAKEDAYVAGVAAVEGSQWEALATNQESPSTMTRRGSNFRMDKSGMQYPEADFQASALDQDLEPPRDTTRGAAQQSPAYRAGTALDSSNRHLITVQGGQEHEDTGVDGMSPLGFMTNSYPPPPPAPLPRTGTRLSQKEKDRLFWAALRGEVPATDMVRERY